MQVPNCNLPFEDGIYTGSIRISIEKSEGSYSVEATGERIKLRTFYHPESMTQLSERFSSHLFPESPKDIGELLSVFSKPKTVQNYLSGKPRQIEAIEKCVKKDCTRSLSGNPFTGYAISNSRKIII